LDIWGIVFSPQKYLETEIEGRGNHPNPLSRTTGRKFLIGDFRGIGPGETTDCGRWFEEKSGVSETDKGKFSKKVACTRGSPSRETERNLGKGRNSLSCFRKGKNVLFEKKAPKSKNSGLRDKGKFEALYRL